MKFALIYASLVVVAFSTTLSQPTYDFNQVSECGPCQQEIEMLRQQFVREFILLKDKVDSVVNDNGRKDATSSPTAVSKSKLI